MLLMLAWIPVQAVDGVDNVADCLHVESTVELWRCRPKYWSVERFPGRRRRRR